jgi:excisionase family DNA binding protein
MNRKEARLFLGDGTLMADRTFARLVADEGGKRGWQVRQTKQGKQVIYDDDDLHQLRDVLIGERAILTAKPIASPTDASHTNGKLARQMKRPAGKGIDADSMMLAFGNLAAMMAGNQPTANEVPLTEKLTLTTKEAGKLSGLPVAFIRQSIANGNLAALKTGAGWRIGRQALGAFVTHVTEQGREGEPAHYSERSP